MRNVYFNTYDVRFESEKAAQNVIDAMKTFIHNYGMVSAADFYDIVGVGSSYTDCKYGWKSLEGTQIERHTDGYSIEFPKQVELRYGWFMWDCPKHDDEVNHPKHYKANNGLEAIQVISGFTSDLTGMEAVCTANVLKYILRWKHKNGLEDLKKAQWYLEYLISELETRNNTMEETK